MRWLSAPWIYPISSPPVKNGVLALSDSGEIEKLFDPRFDDLPADIGIRQYEGLLCPGFINAHCHLELSHLRGKLTRKKFLPHFISEVVSLRGTDDETILGAMVEAEDEMRRNGIVAVGDISNSSLSAQIKSASRIYYHTFIELFDILPGRAAKVFQEGLALQKAFEAKNLHVSLAPHSPYTVTKELFQLITNEARRNLSPVCIHNQETESENEMFRTASGPLLEQLRKMTGGFQQFAGNGKTSFGNIIPFTTTGAPFQLVHNTFTSREDVALAAGEKEVFRNLFWCLCPNANLFIEDTLPDIPLLLQYDCQITVGTDSLASNDSLSILEELKTIRKNFPAVPIESLLKWATLNGAQFLGIDETHGSFAPGKSPGIINITFPDQNSVNLSENSKAVLVCP